jgi:hypothetical protein
MNKLAKKLVELIDLSDKEPNPARALGHLESAKKVLQDLYYVAWLKYHQSGTSK